MKHGPPLGHPTPDQPTRNIAGAMPTADVPANPTILAAMRQKAEQAAISDVDIAKHLGVETLDGLTVSQVEKAVQFISNPF